MGIRVPDCRLLTTPVAGTALYIMDQYLNPRNLAAFAAVFAVAGILEKKYLRALAWIAFAACVHPLMWVFPFSFGALWLVIEQIERRTGWRVEGTAALGLFCLSAFPSAPCFTGLPRIREDACLLLHTGLAVV